MNINPLPTTKVLRCRLAIAALLLSLVSLHSVAQVAMVTTDSYSQNFNTLLATGTGTWTDNSTIANWYSQRTGTGTGIAADAGAATGGNLYSYGAASAVDRALGSLGSGNAAAGSFAHGVLLRNTSGFVITSITITYALEQWRNSAAAAQAITVWYKTSSTAITALNPNVNTTWTQIPGATLSSPITGGTAGALDGNLAANRVVVTAVAIPGLSLANNDYIMIKWEDPDHTGTDHGLAIDDVTIAWTAAPACTSPLAFNVTGSGSYCSGGPGLPVGVAGSEVGMNYQLFLGAAPVGAFVPGTGSAISFGNQTVAGTYTVIATNTTGGCTTTMTGSAVVTVNPTVTPAVGVSANPGTTVCNLTPQIIFTASPTNGGAVPLYNWFTNDVSTGVTTPDYTNNTPVDGDQVYVVMTSTALCTTQPTASSVTNTITVTTAVTPSVGLSVSPLGAVCPGTLLTFTATPVNGGTPSFEWFTNGVSTTVTTPTYASSSLVNGEEVYVVMTSSDPCASPATVTSITNLAAISPSVTPAISIVSDHGDTICAGRTVIFSAAPINGGIAPFYQWQSNSVNVGVNSASYTNSALVTGSIITCTLTPSAEVCPSPASATSTPITMTVNANVTPTVTVAAVPPSPVCAGTTVTFTATPVNGGLTPAYQWRKNGVAILDETNATYTTSAFVNGDAITVVVTPSADICVSPATATSANFVMTVNTFQLVGNAALSENFGTPTATTLVTAYTGWQSTSPITFTSTSTASSDVRTTGASTGYAGASGSGNVFFGTSGGADKNLIIAGIDTSLMVAPQLQFGLLKPVASVDPFVVEISTNGTDWTALTVPQPAVVNVWTLTTPSGAIPSVPNLRIRFSKNSAVAQYRIDDVKVRDVTTAANITASGPTTFCAGGAVTLTATAGGSAYSWSTGATTPSIVVTTSGNYTVTVFDANGCSATANVSVTVNPLPVVTVDPVLTNVECGSAVTLTAVASGSGELSYQWFDIATNAIPDATNATLTLVDVHAPAAGNYTVLVSDATCSASAVATVSVVDTLAPALTLLGNNPVTNESCAIYLDAGATAVDACSASVTLTTNSTMLENAPGVYSVTYTADDGNGNTNSITRTVYVVDTIAPTITLLGDTSVTNECHVAYLDAGATAQDSCSASVTLTTNSTVDANVPGVYSVTYTADDGNGNTNTLSRTVYVIDTVAPAITLLGDPSVTNECHVAYVDAGATALDACSGSVTLATNSTVDANVPGAYSVTYTADDGNGNTNTLSRTVYVVDTTAPLVTVLGASPATNFAFVPFVDPGATVTDGCDASATIVTNGTVDVSLPGSYTLEYVGTDAAGNSATNTRVVQVIALEVPVITSEQRVGDAFEVTFTGPDGQPYKLLTTTDLTLPMSSWTVLSTGAFPATPVVYSDNSITNDAARFYRVTSP